LAEEEKNLKIKACEIGKRHGEYDSSKGQQPHNKGLDAYSRG
jgi:hypothetical protein